MGACARDLGREGNGVIGLLVLTVESPRANFDRRPAREAEEGQGGSSLTTYFLFARGMGMFDAYGELEAPTLVWLALPPSDPPPPVRD